LFTYLISSSPGVRERREEGGNPKESTSMASPVLVLGAEGINHGLRQGKKHKRRARGGEVSLRPEDKKQLGEKVFRLIKGLLR